jgi:DNA-binding response OmpR family regulator
MCRILVVEDDHALAAGVVRGLRPHGFDVELLTTGAEVVERALAGNFSLIILDLMLPEQSGFDILSRLRTRSPTPIIVLTARTELADRLRSFELGAVDFVTKPFWIEELIARIRARLGLSSAPTAPKRVIVAGTLEIDLDAHTVAVGGEIVKLTRTEQAILAYLAQRPGRAVPRTALASHVLSATEEGSDPRTVDAHITRLRKKLGDEGARIATVWGIGYRFEES